MWCRCVLMIRSNLAHCVQPTKNQSVENTNLLNINQRLSVVNNHNAFAIHLNVELLTHGVHQTNTPRLPWSRDVVRRLYANATNALHQLNAKMGGSYLNILMTAVVSNVSFFFL